jgi:hypothetical protein
MGSAFLFWPSIEPETVRRHFQPFTDVLREIWPAVTRKTEIFLNRRKPRQRSIHPDRARRKTVFVFFVAFCQSRLAKSLRRDPKTNPPADFSPAGGNLFNVSSVGLDREPARRAVAGAVGGLWPLGKASEGLVRIAVKGPGTVNQRAQCHINRAPISGDIIYSFRVHRHYSRVVAIGPV